MRGRLGAIAVIVASALVCATATTAAPANLTVTVLGPIQSAAEHAGVLYDERDGGFSAPIGDGRSLWVFGDSLILHGTAPFALARWVTGSTAAIGATTPPGPPDSLDEVQPGVTRLSASTPPVHFLSSFTRIYLPGGHDQLCLDSTHHYPARWPVGITKLSYVPVVLVDFVDACVFSLSDWYVEGFGVAEFDVATSRFTLTPTDVLAPATDGASVPWPAYSFYPVTEPNGDVDLFVWRDNGLEVAQIRPTAARLLAPSTYAHPKSAAAPNGWASHLEYVGYFASRPAGLGPFLALGWSSTTGSAAVMSAPTSTGPWTDVGTAALPGCASAVSECRSVEGHPELSVGSTMAVSYYRKGSAAAGTEHLVLAQVSL